MNESTNESTFFDFSTLTGHHTQHIASCKTRPCTQCDLDLCKCGKDRSAHGTLREIEGGSRVLMLCEECADAEVLQLRVRRVESTIPASFEWARPGVPELRQRSAITGEQFRQAWKDCVLGRAPLVLIGEAGAGKTSAVVTLLRGLIAHGMRAEATPADRRRAFGAAMFAAQDLARDRAKHPLGSGEAPLVARAIVSTVAVIDDLGNETETLSAIGDVIHERHAQGRPTWITTYLNEAEATRKYSGGIARRIFERATVLTIARRTT